MNSINVNGQDYLVIPNHGRSSIKLEEALDRINESIEGVIGPMRCRWDVDCYDKLDDLWEFPYLAGDKICMGLVDAYQIETSLRTDLKFSPIYALLLPGDAGFLVKR